LAEETKVLKENRVLATLSTTWPDLGLLLLLIVLVIVAISGGFPRCASLQEKQALVQSAPVTKDGLGHGKLVNQVKETRVARSSGGHPCLFVNFPLAVHYFCSSPGFVVQVSLPLTDLINGVVFS
jgi:amino acid transporter